MPDTAFHYEIMGVPVDQASHVLVWGHGWGQRGAAFRSICQSLPGCAHILLDFPGFGQSPPPSSAWETGEYADATAALIKKISPNKKVLWLGHSFGGRVGLQLGVRYPEILSGICLIAAAGLPRQKSLLQKLKLKSRIMLFKLTRRLATSLPGSFFENLKNKLGSADYQTAGVMRPIFVKVVNENLTEIARQVKAPTLLIYGANDTETPPEIGERLARLIPAAKLVVLPGQDHYSVLGEGRHVVVKHLQQFIDRL